MLGAVLLALSLLAGPAAAPAKSAPSVFDHKDWIGVCDNTQRCSAMGLAPGGEDRAYLLVQRDGDPGAAAELKLAIYSDSNIPSGPVHLHAAGFDIDLPGLWSDDEIVAESDDPGVISAFARISASDAKTLQVTVGKTEVSLSLAGASAALLWMDDRQGRAGSATALIRRGPKPMAALLPSPSPPIYAPAPKGSAVEIKPVSLPKALLSRSELRDCDRDQLAQSDERGAWRLGPDLTLWSVPCSLGAYNLKSVFFLSDGHAGSIRPAPIPLISPPNTETAPDPPSSLLNADFDPKTMILSAFEKQRGVGDCGTLDRFLWDGRNFQPLEIDYMPECRGVTPEAWPALYRGRVK